MKSESGAGLVAREAARQVNDAGASQATGGVGASEDYDDPEGLEDYNEEDWDDDFRFDCGLDPETGQCAMAGSEDCDFECELRDSEYFAGSRAYCDKHKQLFYTEVELARHALGLSKDRKQSYRNHFVAGEGHDDYATWMDIVRKGLAVRIDKRDVFGGDFLFVLTRDGAEQALYTGESLDPEDFPSRPNATPPSQDPTAGESNDAP